MAKNKIVQLIGIPGSGKDSVGPAIANGSGATYINFSTVMANCAQTNGVDLASTEFEHLDRTTREKIVTDSLAFVKDNQPIVVNTHTVYRNKEGLFEINYASEFVLDCMAYIHMFSPAEQIARRIAADNSSGRRKRSFHLEELRFMQDISIYATRRITDLLGSQFFLLPNHDGTLEETIYQGRKIVGDLF